MSNDGSNNGELKSKKNPEGARKNAQMIVVCTSPDICKTPRGSSTPEVAYQIVGNFNDSVSISPNVRFTGNPVYMLDQSVITKVTGDEPGTKGGVQSGTNVSTCEPIEGCKKFRVNGKQVVAHDDQFKMNNGNTMGKAVIQVNSAPASLSTSGIYDERFHLVDAADGETPLPYRRYRITGSDGQTWEGTSDAEGMTLRIYTDEGVDLAIEIFDDGDDEKEIE